MKTVKLKSGEIRRYNNNQALTIVHSGMGDYCPKDLWKRQEQIGPYAPKKEGDK